MQVQIKAASIETPKSKDNAVMVFHLTLFTPIQPTSIVAQFTIFDKFESAIYNDRRGCAFSIDYGEEGANVKKIINLFLPVALLGILFFVTEITVSAVNNDQHSEIITQTISNPAVFENAENISEVVEQINAFYEQNEQLPGEIGILAAPGTKWGNGTIRSDGTGGNYVTSFFWVKGSNMSTLNVVGRAQRKAVIAKYGSVNGNTSYKMKTQQRVVDSASQTQGYITISAQAWCYARD